MTFLSRFGNMSVVDEPVYKSELVGGLGYVAGFFSQTTDSVVITNTTTETTLIDGGVGTLSVPANTFLKGNAYSVRIGGIINCQNGDTITLKTKSGSTILGTTGLITLKQATNKVWQMDINFVIREIGISGVASIKTHFFFSYEEDSSDKISTQAYDVLNNTTFDTTILNTLDITAQWGTAKIQDQIYSTIFNLNKVF